VELLSTLPAYIAERMESAMLVERNVRVINVEVVGEAYDIAAYYLKKTGFIPDDSLISDSLLEVIYKLFHSGVRNRLLLANTAIGKFERAAR
jgi:hypothetical protein